MFRLKSPFTVQLELTNGCNNKCIHCYNYLRYLRGEEELLMDLNLPIAHFSNILQQLAGLEVRVVILTGGEPFLRRDLLFPLARQAKQANMTVGINTNGTLVSEQDAAELMTIGVDFVLVSLMSSHPQVHNRIAQADNFEATIRGIKLLVEAGLNVSVNMVVSKINLDDVQETSQLVKKLGVRGFSATPAIACYLSDNHRSILLEPAEVKKTLNDLLLAKETCLDVDVLEPLVHCMFSKDERLRFGGFLDHRSCSAGITEAAISPEGDVRPCILKWTPLSRQLNTSS